MSCSRGAASPNLHTQRRLFAASAGYCQNPACTRELFIEYPNAHIHVAEMAHVFAASEDGPRSNRSLTKAERGSFENLILLCSLCHTIIDKAPEEYPDSLILKWKRNHTEKLRALFGSGKYASRSEVKKAIQASLQENRRIFEDYGPHIDAARNPESGAAERWQRKVLEKIIPNNRRVEALLDANKSLLTDDELTVLEKFRQHIDDLEARHIEGNRDGASQFPLEMSTLLKD
jgi:Arc/MetJ-type ribon-helix-helix transcriptional regulator